MKKLAIAACMAVMAFVVSSSVLAEDTPTVARMWKVVPKAGTAEQFEAALKAHADFRRANGDPWTWNIYRVETGDLDGGWFIRTPGHTWADIDAYFNGDFSRKAGDHWNQTVHGLVESYASHFAEFVPEISNWPEGAVYEFYWVYEYHLKPGRAQAFEAAAKAITDVLKEVQWDDTWAFTRHLTGTVPAYSLVLPEGGWAGLAGPDSTAYEAVAAARGEEAARAMWSAFADNLGDVQSTIYRRYAEMSIKGASD